MDNYLINRETLGKFIDELIKQNPLDIADVDELNRIRESAIAKLDEAIGLAIFSQFTQAQNAEYNQLLDRDATEDDYQEFFQRSGIDVDRTIAEATQKFANEFIGGQNA